jgi:disulfide bond formation protein DsbB
MIDRSLVLLATAGSFLLLGGAFVFQALGYAPCALCLWQRWPHAAAIVLGVLALTVAPMRLVAGLGALAALTTGGIGIYHTGVERGWWEGPSSCSSSGGDGLGGLSAESLLPGSAAVDPVVMCDEVAWQFMGLSMASWNASASLALAVVWVLAATARRPT